MDNPQLRQCLECWQAQALRIRCALLPDDPRQFDLHEAHGRQIAARGGLDRWQMWRQVAELLLDTAADPALPLHWRSQCLDRLWRPLYALQQLASDHDRRQRLSSLRNRLARLHLAPSISYDEPAQGHFHG